MYAEAHLCKPLKKAIVSKAAAPKLLFCSVWIHFGIPDGFYLFGGRLRAGAFRINAVAVRRLDFHTVIWYHRSILTGICRERKD